VKLAIVVPVKSPQRAKHRLEALMSPEERATLAITMARDVMGVVAQLTEYGRFVVSDDAEVLAMSPRVWARTPGRPPAAGPERCRAAGI